MVTKGAVTGLVQGRQIDDVAEGMEAGATRLLGIDGLVVARVERDGGGARVVHVVTADETASVCPDCGVLSRSVKGPACSAPRGIPYAEARVGLVWHKRRWRCRETRCSRRSFTESIPDIPPRARVTARLKRACGVGIAERFSCVAAAAAHYGVSWWVAHRAYIAHVSAALAAPPPPVCVLGIDETRRGKPRWVQDPATGRWRLGADRWHTAFVDAVGTGGLLGHVDGRTSGKVTEWLDQQPDSWRAGITHVTIDLSAAYLKAVTAHVACALDQQERVCGSPPRTGRAI